MPIRAEYRHLYRGPAWQATRARILKRAAHCCEQCRKPNGARVYTYTWKTRNLAFGSGWEYHMVWMLDSPAGRWIDQSAREVPADLWPAQGLPRIIRVQLGVAHLNHEPYDSRDCNLRAWCTWCHLHHDAPHHKATRCERKDAPRPVLQSQV